MHVRKKKIKLEGFDSDFTKHDREFFSNNGLKQTSSHGLKSSALRICQTSTGKNISKPIPEQFKSPIR